MIRELVLVPAAKPTQGLVLTDPYGHPCACSSTLALSIKSPPLSGLLYYKHFSPFVRLRKL